MSDRQTEYLKLEVEHMVRPVLTIEEQEQPDGSYLPGKQLWTGAVFSSPRDPFELCGLYERLTLEWVNSLGQTETWKFTNCRVAAMPSALGAANQNLYDFMLFFERCQFVTPSPESNFRLLE